MDGQSLRSLLYHSREIRTFCPIWSPATSSGALEAPPRSQFLRRIQTPIWKTRSSLTHMPLLGQITRSISFSHLAHLVTSLFSSARVLALGEKFLAHADDGRKKQNEEKFIHIGRDFRLRRIFSEQSSLRMFFSVQESAIGCRSNLNWTRSLTSGGKWKECVSGAHDTRKSTGSIQKRLINSSYAQPGYTLQSTFLTMLQKHGGISNGAPQYQAPPPQSFFAAALTCDLLNSYLRISGNIIIFLIRSSSFFKSGYQSSYFYTFPTIFWKKLPHIHPTHLDIIIMNNANLIVQISSALSHGSHVILSLREFTVTPRNNIISNNLAEIVINVLRKSSQLMFWEVYHGEATWWLRKMELFVHKIALV